MPPLTARSLRLKQVTRSKGKLFSTKTESKSLKLRLVLMRAKGKTVKKSDLPQKVCRVCLRPFTWRKKWASCWEAVIYCSERCRRERVQ